MQRARRGQAVEARHGVCPTWRAGRRHRRHQVGASPRHGRPQHGLRGAVGLVCKARKNSLIIVAEESDRKMNLTFFKLRNCSVDKVTE